MNTSVHDLITEIFDTLNHTDVYPQFDPNENDDQMNFDPQSGTITFYRQDVEYTLSLRKTYKAKP